MPVDVSKQLAVKQNSLKQSLPIFQVKKYFDGTTISQATNVMTEELVRFTGLVNGS